MEFGYDFWVFIVRWLHVLSGIMWIGLLWYFNFVQTPTVPTIPEEMRPAIPKHIMPVALFWFRWAALSTVVWGLILAWMNGYLSESLALGLTDGVAKHASIGFGMWMGLIMAFNVWFIIWPNQQKVIGLVEASVGGEISGDQIKKRGLACAVRTNDTKCRSLLNSEINAVRHNNGAKGFREPL